MHLQALSYLARIYLEANECYTLTEIFDTIELECGGAITLQKVSQILESDENASQIKAMFAQIDQNQDGEITFSELIPYLIHDEVPTSD